MTKFKNVILDYETCHIIDGISVNFATQPLMFKLRNAGGHEISIAIMAWQKHRNGIRYDIRVDSFDDDNTSQDGTYQQHMGKSLAAAINGWPHIEIIH